MISEIPVADFEVDIMVARSRRRSKEALERRTEALRNEMEWTDEDDESHSLGLWWV